MKDFRIRKEMNHFFSGYLSKGYRSKKGNNEHRANYKRAFKFVTWTNNVYNVNTIHRIGKKHVIYFYYHLLEEGLSHKTIRDYHRSISLLWVFSGKKSTVPDPRLICTNSD